MENTKKGLDLQQLEKVSGGMRNNDNLHGLIGRDDDNLHHMTGQKDDNLRGLIGRDDDNLHHRLM